MGQFFEMEMDNIILLNERFNITANQKFKVERIDESRIKVIDEYFEFTFPKHIMN